MSNKRNQARAVLLSVIMIFSVIAVGVSALSGAAGAQQSTDDFDVTDGFNQNVSIGSEPAEISRITLNDNGGSVFGGGETTISFAEDSGVTWQNVDRAVYLGNEINTSISQSGQTLTIATEESSSNNDSLRLINPEVNVAPDASTGNVSAEVNYFIGTTTVDGLVNLSKPQLTGSSQVISLGTVDAPFDSGKINISTQSDAGEIGSEVVLTSAPDDGFSWNTTNTSADEIYNSTLSDLSADTSDATISESEIRIPITDGPSSAANTNVSFDASNLTVDVAGDAVNTTFGAAVVAANGNSDVVLNQTYAVNSTAETTINLNSPNSIPIGSVNQSISGNDVAINVTETGDDNIGAGTNLTVSTDSQFVSFNETQLNNTQGIIGKNTPAVQDGDITINIDTQSDTGDHVEFNATTVAVASNAPNGTVVNFTATTQSSQGAAEVTVTNTTSSLVLRTPKTQFNGTDNVELFTDNQGVTTPGNVEVANITINATTDDQFGVGENVTVEFADTSPGVTFNSSEGDFDITGTSDPVVVADDGSSLEFNITSALGPSDQLNISNTSYDVEPDAQNVSLDVTVPTNVSDVSVEFGGQYTVTQASATAVNNVTDDSVTKQVGKTEEVTFNVTSGNLDRALSTNNQSFAGAETELNLSSSPDTFEGTLSDVVSAEDLTTDSGGEGGFNFSSETTGDYTIFVNETNDDAGQAFDFTVSSGNVSDITAEGVENAFSGGANDLDDNQQTAVYKVDLLDSEGNLVTRDDTFEFRVLAGSQTSEIIGLSDDLADDGTGTSANATITPGGNNEGPLFNATSSSDNNVFQYNATDDTTNEQGTFFVYVANDLAEDTDVQIVPRGSSSDIDPDSGTATFFNSVDTVTIDAPSSLSVGENVNATATAQTSGGTTIEVPRLSASFTSDNGTVVTVENSIDTDTSGVATGNITADAAGVSNLTATVDSIESESQTITVEEAQQQEPSVSVTFNDQSVQNGTEEVTVDSANFTRADGSAGDYVVVVHVVNDTEFDGGLDSSISAPVGASGNLSNGAESITVDLNSSAAFEGDDALDTLSENVTLRAMLHTTANDSAFGTRLGNAIDGIEPGDETDDADITVTPASPLDGPAAEFDADADGDISITELGDAGTAFAQGDLTIAELGAVGQEFAS